MDNASKALIMAGAVLISIAVIGVGIYIYNQSVTLTQGSTNQIKTLSQNLSKSMPEISSLR